MKKISKTSLFFYVMAFLVFLGFIAATYSVTVYVMGLVSEGSVSLPGDLLNVILYYMSNSLQYLVYALLLVAVGYIIQLLKKRKEV